jgi:hypothetical protein
MASALTWHSRVAGPTFLAPNAPPTPEPGLSNRSVDRTTTGNSVHLCKRLLKNLTALTFWAIAFAFVEAAVVDYLRAIYYPIDKGGFQFPLLTLDQVVAMGDEHWRRLLIELGRELSTLIMLAAMGVAAGKNKREMWAYFLIGFGVWDISFYLWLKLLLDWPVSIMTWDLIFLLPVPWVSPVLAPTLVSIVMITCGAIILYCECVNRPLRTTWGDWALLVGAGLIVVASFCWDCQNIMNGGLPNPFNWLLFGVGLLIGVAAFGEILRRNARNPGIGSV